LNAWEEEWQKKTAEGNIAELYFPIRLQTYLKLAHPTPLGNIPIVSKFAMIQHACVGKISCQLTTYPESVSYYSKKGIYLGGMWKMCAKQRQTV
jgi:hypothetical protein